MSQDWIGYSYAALVWAGGIMGYVKAGKDDYTFPKCLLTLPSIYFKVTCQEILIEFCM